LREGNLLGLRALARILKQGEQCKQQQDDDHPKGEIAEVGVHALRPSRPRGSQRPLVLAATRGRFTSIPGNNVGLAGGPAKGTAAIWPILPRFASYRRFGIVRRPCLRVVKALLRLLFRAARAGARSIVSRSPISVT